MRLIREKLIYYMEKSSNVKTYSSLLVEKQTIKGNKSKSKKDRELQRYKV